MNTPGAQDKIIESIRSSETILITVSQHPSVDKLAAALGLTMYLNDIGKHATAVMSGDIPPAITFLKPEKTFKNSVDSLRDFVIALDKEKADHLRYKVEGDVVKIFITPYRTVITDDQLAAGLLRFVAANRVGNLKTADAEAFEQLTDVGMVVDGEHYLTPCLGHHLCSKTVCGRVWSASCKRAAVLSTICKIFVRERDKKKAKFCRIFVMYRNAPT